jgi:hypothetical protein
VTLALVMALLGPTPAPAEEPGAMAANRDGCSVQVTSKDAQGVAGIAADCHWPVPASEVARVLQDQGDLDAVLSSVSESTVLADGHILQVHSFGFGIADRQVTLAFRSEALAGRGLRLHFRRAPRQQRLAVDRVEIREDTGFWQVTPDEDAGTRLRYAVRYDPGGRIAPWLVTRFLRSGIERALREVRSAAEQAGLAASASRVARSAD